MTEHRVLLQPAYVLHQRAYRDTSAIVELFSPEHGRVGVVARGVRGAKSRWRGVLQVFQPLLASWSLRGDLGTLTALEPDGLSLSLAADYIASGFYLNEILMRLLTRHDPHPELFDHYDKVLRDIAKLDATTAEAKVQLESLLRAFELQLLTELGYGLVLDHDIHTNIPVSAEQDYIYLFERGPVAAQADGVEKDAVVTISGQTLLALQAGNLAERKSRSEAKHLLRAILGRYLGNKPLLSRQLMQPVGRSQATPAFANRENTPDAIP